MRVRVLHAEDGRGQGRVRLIWARLCHEGVTQELWMPRLVR